MVSLGHDIIDGTTEAKVEAQLNGWTAIKPSRETGERECG